MNRDLEVDHSVGVVVLSWKSFEGELLLQVRGQPEDVRLVCRCGRTHWIVREDESGKGANLVLICHHCGTRVAFPLERVRIAAPRA